MPREWRIYPAACLSAFCGAGPAQCGGCPAKPAKDEFLAWVEANNAVVADPVWSPNVYISQKGA